VVIYFILGYLLDIIKATGQKRGKMRDL